MNKTVQFAVLFLAVAFIAGCAQRKIATPVAPLPAPAQKVPVVVLLKEADGTFGRVTIRNAHGVVQLEQPNTAVKIVSADSGPGAPEVMDDSEVRRRFGSVLRALPDAEIRFTLHFLEASDTLTAESEALLGQIAKVIQDRRSTFVSVTGHTDTTGTDESNYQLGLKRAERLAEIVKTSGVPATAFWISSHGEGDLVVKTPDNVAEVKNRRVEIVIR
jgi:outer membrane protein OmpA-like peptidoglycan-associated protein